MRPAETESNIGRRRLPLLRDAAALAVLYFPALALSELAERIPSFDFHLLLYPLLIGLLCAGALLSETPKAALKKWGLSVPFSLAFGLLLSAAHFSVRLVNMLDPGYGNLSAGGGFALAFRFVVLSVVHCVANLLAVGLSAAIGSRTQRLRAVLQGVVIPLIAGGILLIVLCLAFTMPSIGEIRLAAGYGG